MIINSGKSDSLPAITVVMAVYNAKKSVGRAIDSVLAQTYQNWQLICVDDGSTDNSLEILHEYERRDSRIKVLTKENGGPASARALAYSVMNTPYATYLDSDDYISEDLLMSEAKSVIETRADAVAPNFISIHPSGEKSNWNKDNNLTEGQTMSGVDAFKRTFISPSMHCCNLWRSDLLKKFATNEYLHGCKLNSDEYIQHILLLNCNKIAICGGEYIYNYNAESITKKFSLRHLEYLDTCRKYVDLINEYKLDENTSSLIREYYMRHVIHLQIRYYRDSKEIDGKDRKIIKRTLKESYKDAMTYKSSIHFNEKKLPWLYRFVSTNGYSLFDFTCRVMSMR